MSTVHADVKLKKTSFCDSYGDDGVVACVLFLFVVFVVVVVVTDYEHYLECRSIIHACSVFTHTHTHTVSTVYADVELKKTSFCDSYGDDGVVA